MLHAPVTRCSQSRNTLSSHSTTGDSSQDAWQRYSKLANEEQFLVAQD